MIDVKQISDSVKKLPEAVKRFLIRAAVLFAGWKILYLFILIPSEVPDAWLVKQLGSGTASVLNVVYGTNEFKAVATRRQKVYGSDEVNVTFSNVQKEEKKLIGIYQACNGLELMILYAGFIIAFAGKWRTKLLFVVAGLFGLYIINVLRLVMLGYICIEYPAHFQFAHKYLFNLVVYAFTFLLWVWYVTASKVKAVPGVQNA